MLPVGHDLFLSLALLLIGVIGALIRRNIVIQFFSVGLVFVAAAVNFAAFARLFADVAGQTFARVIIAFIALETIVGLAIVAAVFSRWQHPPPAADQRATATEVK
jgi:NADH-quinone oxidoreductase subunit K